MMHYFIQEIHDKQLVGYLNVLLFLHQLQSLPKRKLNRALSGNQSEVDLDASQN